MRTNTGTLAVGAAYTVGWLENRPAPSNEGWLLGSSVIEIFRQPS
jgi:hypothetical protein